MCLNTSIIFVLLGTFLLSGCNGQRSEDPGKETVNWPLHGLTHQEQRFSPLNEINEQTVARLGLVWSHELVSTRGLEATPIVIDGVIYTTSAWSVVHAIDARSGKFLWTFDPAVPRARARVLCCDAVNRGVAFDSGRIFVGTLDGRLIALDAKSGNLIWDVATFDPARGYSITGAPRIAGNLVVIGNGGAEMGVRGYVSAYDVESGELVWRTFTVPGDPSEDFESDAMKSAAQTWSGEWWRGGGGGTAWDSMVFDPALDLVYVGTGNGAPWYRNLRSPGGGDNLYLSSILALRATNGEQVWHFQTTPGDHWDFTATQPLMLADLLIEDRLRKVIMQAPKNGFFYVLDRETGQFLSAAAFANITWATGVDPQTGRPVEASDAFTDNKPFIVSPDPSGAHNWYPMAYSPDTGLVYIPVRDETTFLHRPDVGWQPNDSHRNEGIDTRYDGPLVDQWLNAPLPTGRLVAWDPIAQEARWKIDFPVLESGGVLATAGNLVFQGRSDGVFAAYQATDGAQLWQFDAGTGIMAAPVTYRVDGIQYVTVMAGWGGGMGLINPPVLGPIKPGHGRVLTFALDATATFKATPFGHSEPPVPARLTDANPAVIREGQALYDLHCFGCHGVMAVAGPLPDLRYATAEVHEQFEAIVRYGARETLGMPGFGDLLSQDQVRAIQDYVLSQAEASAVH
jgi:quinohemoprotein ethanol dehydrogenase